MEDVKNNDTTDAGDDIANFAAADSAEEGAVLELKHPRTGNTLRHPDGHAMTITLRGRDSKMVTAVAQKQQDRRIQMNMRTRAPILTEVIDKDDIEVLIKATKSWDIIFGGNVPASKEEEYRKVYSDPNFKWLREQAEEFIGVRSNFIKG